MRDITLRVFTTMADTVPKEVRSRMMASIKGRNTIPELLVRSKLFQEGFRFRLHRRDLPGTPDIVLPRYRTVIFVNGCFWHSHNCPEGRVVPKTRTEFWKAKLDGNVARDRANQRKLESLNWRVFVIWSCQIESDTERILDDLRKFESAMTASKRNE